MQSMHNVHIISTLHSKDLHKEEKVYVASCTWSPLSCYHKSRDTLFLQTSVLKKSSKLCCLYPRTAPIVSYSISSSVIFLVTLSFSRSVQGGDEHLIQYLVYFVIFHQWSPVTLFLYRPVPGGEGTPS